MQPHIVALCVAAPFIHSLVAAPAQCPLVPPPKEYRETGRPVQMLGAKDAAIVIGDKATKPERYAAERLQTLVQRRFKRHLPIQNESELSTNVLQVFLLGQRTTNTWLDRLCRERGIDLGSTSPGHDGFVVEVLNDGGRTIVVAGGSNARGVIYGQDVVFDLMRREGEAKVFLPAVSIRDWPSVPWRGRPYSRMRHHLTPGTFDAYVRSRLNFLDVRDAKGGVAAFGFPPGFKIDEPVVKEILTEAHRRGMFVYGTVSCGVKPNRFDAAVKAFEELIALGVDGLWVSFDDPGPGREANVLIQRVVELGKRHGMDGRRIATTPPTGSYQHIETDFNRGAAKVSGFADATWFFTRVPCQRDVESTRKIGLGRLPGWWHNWPRTQGGFLHDSYGGRTLRAEGKPTYLDLPPLRVGWHSPRYDRTRDGAKHTDTVMMWGGWPEEYTTGVLGLWAWDPKTHDWERTRESIYAYVFGPGLAGTAKEFDDRLAELKSLFHLPVRRTKPKEGWPCRLKRLDDRPAALKLIGQLEASLQTLESGAPMGTAILLGRLTDLFLEPMRATLTFVRRMTELDYPEYSLGDFTASMIELVDTEKTAAAQQDLAEVRPKVAAQLAKVEEALQGLTGIDEYVSGWRQRLSGIDYWTRLAARRRAQMKKRFDKLVKGSDYDPLLARSAVPPAGKALAQLQPTQWLKRPARWAGAFGAGLLEHGRHRALAITFPGRTGSKVGDHVEVRADMSVPQFDGRLMLDAFVNDTHVTDRWTRYRFMQLWVNDKLVWEEDIALSREGREWIAVDVTDLAKGAARFALRFRVEDRRRVGNYPDLTVVGPVRLRSADAP